MQLTSKQHPGVVCLSTVAVCPIPTSKTLMQFYKHTSTTFQGWDINLSIWRAPWGPIDIFIARRVGGDVSGTLIPGTVFGGRWRWHDAGSIIDIWRIRVSFFLGFWGLFFAFMSWCGFWYIFIRFWFPPPLSRGPYYMHQLLPFHSHCIRDVHPLYCCSGRAWTFIICCSWFMPIWQACLLITSLFSDILSSVTRHDFTWCDWRMA